MGRPVGSGQADAGLPKGSKEKPRREKRRGGASNDLGSFLSIAVSLSLSSALMSDIWPWRKENEGQGGCDDDG